MTVDARRRYELYVELEDLFGEVGASTLMRSLAQIGERRDVQLRNRELGRADAPARYRLYAAMHRNLSAEATATFMELLDPLGWTESLPAASSTVAGPHEGGDDGVG